MIASLENAAKTRRLLPLFALSFLVEACPSRQVPIGDSEPARNEDALAFDGSDRSDGSDASDTSDGSDGSSPYRDAGSEDAGEGEDAPPTSDVFVIDDSGIQDAGVHEDGSLPDGSNPLETLRASVIELHGWKFRIDPNDEGAREGWQAEAFSDQSWQVIEAGRPWEAQGHSDYDGIAWYRANVVIPSSWSGSEVTFVASGVDDEYDLYINGQWVRHHGQRPERTVYQAKTISSIHHLLRFGQSNLIAVRVNDWGGGGGLWRAVALKQSVPLTPYRSLLPEPVLPAHPDWVALYWAAWQMAFDKVSFGNERNNLAAAYMDEGFNEQIYQWDTSFIVLFGKYGSRLFPVMPSLDNFYTRQRTDGYIQRVYSETDGREVEQPTEDEPVINPPLFAWVERSYYDFSGDSSRLPRVFPILERYFEWIETNLRKPAGQGLYYQTGLGSGMDNTPRGDVHHAGWIDMSSQQALAALELSRIAHALGDQESAERWRAKHAEISSLINRHAWNDEDGIYYDLAVSGGPNRIKHIGAFWTLLAEVATEAQVLRLVEHLRNPQEFWRPHVFPSLAASERDFDAKGHYWRGSVWAPTNYATITGLAARGQRALARDASANHLTAMAQVFATPPAPEGIAPEERDDHAQTIWECYSSDLPLPGTRWDNQYFCRQDFVGWSGLGPIALLIEQIMGIEVIGKENKIVWHLDRTDEHGVRRLSVGNQVVDLVAEARDAMEDPVWITAGGSAPFTIEVHRFGRAKASMRFNGGAPQRIRIE